MVTGTNAGQVMTVYPDSPVHNDISGAVTGPVIQAHTIQVDVHLGPDPVTPRQLPAAPRLFTGRTGELAHLTEVLHERGTGVPIAAIAGAGGIGKSRDRIHARCRATAAHGRTGVTTIADVTTTQGHRCC